MSPTDDELDGELRRLFDDERLNVDPAADAERIIVAGAARRRRRRAIAASTGGTVVAAVLVVGGLAVANTPSDPAEPPPVAEPTRTSAVTAPTTVVPGGPPPTSTATETPATGTSAAPSTSAERPTTTGTPSTTPTTSSARARTYSGPVIGPDSYGKLRLGMTEQEANASGVTMRSTVARGGCGQYQFGGSGMPSSGSATVSSQHGIIAIKPSAPAHTPEGIGKGSSASEVYAAYPGSTDSGSRLLAPSGSAGNYAFSLDSAQQQVTEVHLESTNQSCGG